MENHGTDPKLRWRVLRERVLAMKAIWTQDEAEFHGELRQLRPDLELAQADPEAAPADHHRRRRPAHARAGDRVRRRMDAARRLPGDAGRSRSGFRSCSAGGRGRARTDPGHDLRRAARSGRDRALPGRSASIAASSGCLRPPPGTRSCRAWPVRRSGQRLHGLKAARSGRRGPGPSTSSGRTALCRSA